MYPKIIFASFSTFWSHFINRYDWDKIFDLITGRLFQFLLLSLLFLVIRWIGRLIIRKSFKKYQSSRLLSANSNRIDTINSLVLNSFSYIILFFWLYALLTMMGVPVGTLIAGAGIFSLALGLGAQGFVSDIVTGFFIILEQQLDVGDAVKLDGIEGTVTAIGLRTTQVTSYDGTLNFIPNRNIQIVSNLSRNEMRALIEINIYPNAPLEKIHSIIDEVNDQLTPKYPQITKGPTYLGTATTTAGHLSIQVSAYTTPGDQLLVQRAFLSAYLRAIREAGIDLPTSYIN